MESQHAPRNRTRRRWLAVAAGMTAAVLGVTGCGSSSSKDDVSIVGFSILKGVNAKVIADFEQERATGADTAGTERKNLADR